MDEFTGAYIEAALWSSTDDQEEALDRNYTESDIAPETMEKMIADARDFQERFGELIQDDDSPAIDRHGRWEKAGHDFWLTRNRHGAGFWDGDWPKQGDRLTEAAHEYGEFYLYVGDDGLIYGPPADAYGVREAPRRKEPKRVLSFYSGKVVDMATYVPDLKMRFHLAAMRAVDNAGEGYVIEGDSVYFVSKAFRTAKLVRGEEAEKVLAQVSAILSETTGEEEGVREARRREMNARRPAREITWQTDDLNREELEHMLGREWLEKFLRMPKDEAVAKAIARARGAWDANEREHHAYYRSLIRLLQMPSNRSVADRLPAGAENRRRGKR